MAVSRLEHPDGILPSNIRFAPNTVSSLSDFGKINEGHQCSFFIYVKYNAFNEHTFACGYNVEK